jgi:hypothetical protein
MEVECALIVAVKAEEVVPRTLRKARHGHDLAAESQSIQLYPNAFSAFTITIPRRILAGETDEIASEG